MEFLEMVAKAQKGDLRAASLLAKNLGPMVENLCRKYIRQSDYWKDTSQVVFSYFFKQLPGLSFPGKGELVTYLNKLTKNQCLKQLHIDFRYQEKLDLYYCIHADDPVEVEIESLVPDQDIIDLKEMAEKLPDFLRMLVSRIVFEKCPYRELALELNIKEGTLRSHMCRARKILKKINQGKPLSDG